MGTMIVRPSRRSTANSSSLTDTSVACAGCSLVIILIPTLHQPFLVFFNDLDDLSQLFFIEALIPLKSWRRQPELGLAIIAFYVQVRWLGAVSSIKEKPIRANPKHCWHFSARLRLQNLALQYQRFSRSNATDQFQNFLTVFRIYKAAEQFEFF